MICRGSLTAWICSSASEESRICIFLYLVSSKLETEWKSLEKERRCKSRAVENNWCLGPATNRSYDLKGLWCPGRDGASTPLEAIDYLHPKITLLTGQRADQLSLSSDLQELPILFILPNSIFCSPGPVTVSSLAFTHHSWNETNRLDVNNLLLMSACLDHQAAMLIR